MFACPASIRRACLAALLVCAWPGSVPRVAAAAPAPLAELQATFINDALTAYRTKAYADTIALCDQALVRLDALGDRGAEATQLRAHFVLLLAGSHDFLQHSERAISLYEDYLRLSSGILTEDANRSNAEARLAALRGFVVLRVLPREAKITIDGQVTNVPTDLKVALSPGHHLVHIELIGFVAVDRTLEITGGAEVGISVVLEPLEAPTTSTSARAVGAWIAAGIGAVGVVTGIVGVVMAADKRARIEDAADANGVIDEASLSRRQALTLESDANTLSTMALAGFIVAGVGAATTTTLLLLPDPGGPKVRADAGVTGFRVAPLERGAVLGWGTRF